MDSTFVGRALDALDEGVVLLSRDLDCILLVNQVAAPLLAGDRLPRELERAVQTCVAGRLGRLSPRPVHLEHAGRVLYVRVVESAGDPPAEVILIRDAAVRDPVLQRLLRTRFRLTSREFAGARPTGRLPATWDSRPARSPDTCIVCSNALPCPIAPGWSTSSSSWHRAAEPAWTGRLAGRLLAT